MRLFKIETLLLSLPLRPLTEDSWLAVAAIIAIVVLIVYLAYSYVFKKKAKEQKRLTDVRNIRQQDIKEEKNEARK